MDLETYHLIHAWPEIPTDAQGVLDLITSNEVTLDMDFLLYLILREMGA